MFGQVCYCKPRVRFHCFQLASADPADAVVTLNVIMVFSKMVALFLKNKICNKVQWFR